MTQPPCTIETTVRGAESHTVAFSIDDSRLSVTYHSEGEHWSCSEDTLSTEATAAKIGLCTSPSFAFEMASLGHTVAPLQD